MSDIGTHATVVGVIQPPPQIVIIQESSPVRKPPAPFWLEILLVISAMLIVLGQLLCLNQVEERMKQSGIPVQSLSMGYVGGLIAATQVTSDKVFNQVLYLIGVIFVVVFGFVKAHKFGGLPKGWQLMFLASVLWSLDIIAYGILMRNTKIDMGSLIRNLIIYLISVSLSFILFIVGWSTSFGKLFGKLRQKGIGILLQILTLVTALMVMFAPSFVMVSSGKFVIGTTGCIVGLIFVPTIYGIYAWLLYVDEKRKRNDVDVSRLSVSVEDGKLHEANQPLIGH